MTITTPTNEAEQAVLGSMLIDATCIKNVMTSLRPEDFYLTQNIEIFETIRTMFQREQPIDALTVIAEMERNGTYDAVTTRAYLAELMEVTPTSANVLEYADIVKAHSRRRRLQEIGHSLTDDLVSPPDELIASAAERIADLQRSSKAEDLLLSTQDSMLPFLDELASPRSTIKTGYSSFDETLGGGMVRGGLFVIAARPGMGKTTLALNFAESISRTGGVLFVSLEMSTHQLMGKRFARITGIDSTRFMFPETLTERDWQRIAAATAELGKSNLFINRRPGASVADIEEMARSVPNLRAIFVDYLGLVAPERTGSRYEQTSEISNRLKQIANRLDIPVVALCQLSRANEKRESKRPILADLRDSGAIEQDADTVVFVYRDDYYTPVDEHKDPWAAVPIDLIIAKNRHGRCGVCRLEAQLYTSIIREASSFGEPSHEPIFSEIPEQGDEPF